MKYQVLARKYRPKGFSTMVGQEHVLKALTNALESERLHHAYLFTGTRGVGKTTVARVLAKALNCENGITASPCGECAACLEIDEGRFIDLIEVDAASRTKVEDTRDLLDNVQYAPSRGRFKIYLIDEVHMLSASSFNALLKTLEEPPPHVKFLLATTDPQKLPVTILSRCLQFNLKSLTITEIENQLRLILNEEKIAFDDNILKPLAIAADGSMRDGLSLLDQAIAYCDSKPNLADIESMLGSVQKDRIFELLTALANNDGAMLIKQSRILVEQGIDVNTVLAEFITMLQRIALSQQVPDAIDDNLGDKDTIEKIAEVLSAEDIQLYYQIALNGRKDLPFSPQPQGGFEMILLRMLAFKPAGGIQKQKTGETVSKTVADSTANKIAVPKTHSTSIAEPTAKSQPESVASKPKPIEAKPDPVEKTSEHNNSMPEYPDLPPLEAYSQEQNATEYDAQAGSEYEFEAYNSVNSADELKKKASIEEPADNQYQTHSQPPVFSQTPKQTPNQIPSQTPSQTVSNKVDCDESKSQQLDSFWYDLIERSQVNGLVQQLAKHCALIQRSEDESGQIFELLLESVHKHLLNDKMRTRLQTALCETLDSPVKLSIKECQLKAEQQLQTPRRREIQEAEILQQEAVKSIKSDEKLNLLVNSLSAIIREETIKPLGI